MEVTKLGKYEIRATVGRGAVGVVYEAWDPLMARTVAIKVLPLFDLDDEGKEQYERFKREAQAAARLHHPNIVSAFDYGETDNSAYIVMEFLPGPSLKSLLAKREPLELKRIATIMHGVLTGLQHSHNRGVVHRDIKPANIVFSADGDVKITDFGIAHLDTSGITRAGSVLGTPAYMAPEQVLGHKVDARTDLFSAGVVLYEMLTGRRPFEGSTSSVMHKIVHLHPPQPSLLAATVSAGVDAIIAKALAKDPDGRYQSASEFDAALRAELERMPVPASVPSADPAGGVDATVPSNRPLTSVQQPVALRARDRLYSRAAASAPPASRARARGSWPLLLTGTGILAIGAVAWLVLVSADLRHGPAPSVTQRPPPSKADTVAATALPTTGAPLTPPPVTAVTSPKPQEAHAMEPAPAAQTAAAPPSAASPPGPVQAADDPLQPLREQIEAIAATAPCSIITSEVAPGEKVHLRSVSALGDASELEIQATLQRAIRVAVPQAAVTWTTQRIDGPYCPVLDLLRSLPRNRAGFGVAVSLQGHPIQLTGGNTVRVAVAIPSRPVRLALDLFTGDGAVRHLHTGPIDGANPFTAPVLWPEKPDGDQLLTAVASSAALFSEERPKQEPAAAYLKDLRSALTQAGGRDIRLAVDVLPVGGAAP